MARANRRFQVKLPVFFGPDQPTNLGYVINLSKSGAAISCNDVFAATTKLKLMIHPKEDPIPIEGIVCWARQAKLVGEKKISNMHTLGVHFPNPPKELVSYVDEMFKDAKELRRQHRFSKIYPVHFQGAPENRQHQTRDISRGGAFIVTETPPDIDSLVGIKIDLPDLEQPVFIEARVSHVVRVLNSELAERTGMIPGIGVEFVRFLDDSEIDFNRHIDKMESLQESR